MKLDIGSLLAVGLVAGLALSPTAQAGLPKPPKALNVPGSPAHGASAHNSSLNNDYEFIDIALPDAVFPQMWEINNSRMAGGCYIDGQSGQLRTFVWANGELLPPIEKEGATDIGVCAITDSGRLFGNWGTQDKQQAGYYDLVTRRWTALPDFPDRPVNIGDRMSDSGRATGIACRGIVTGPEDCIPWIWNGRSYETLTIPGAIQFEAYGINNASESVGYWLDSVGLIHGFSQRKGEFQDLTTVDNLGMVIPFVAYDLNDNGAILGSAPIDPTSIQWLSAILDKGASTVLPLHPDVYRTFYTGMNQRGDLVGTWFNDPEAPHLFIALRK